MQQTFRALTAVCAVAGIAFLMHWNHGDWNSFVYFTVQSSVIVAAVSAVAVFREVPAWLRGAATLYSCITGIVYHSLLANRASPFYQPDSGLWEMHNILLHSLTPILAAVTWLLIERERVRWWYAAVWLAYPLGYLVFALVRGAFVHEYPYPFIDVNKLHAGGVTQTSLGFTVAFFLLGLLLIGLGAVLRRALPPAPVSDQDARVEDAARI
ncbi:Pr6Pr family membrane protein [Dactylosporangium sp. CA-092794]|uniref:Pr6Pr family membrane protein n=1 Tax=Dactylosporangium sp. CA-092794 TaxID=3239929 RepID=UPI003D94B69E